MLQNRFNVVVFLILFLVKLCFESYKLDFRITTCYKTCFIVRVRNTRTYTLWWSMVICIQYIYTELSLQCILQMRQDVAGDMNAMTKEEFGCKPNTDY